MASTAVGIAVVVVVAAVAAVVVGTVVVATHCGSQYVDDCGSGCCENICCCCSGICCGCWYV